jgi:hypothetical protein
MELKYKAASAYYLSCILLACFVFTGCPDFEVSLTSDETGSAGFTENFMAPLVATNIRVSGSYLPAAGQTVPVQLYYIDGTFNYADIGATGIVSLMSGQIAPPLGKVFHSIYLLNEGTTILLGRPSNYEMIYLKIDASGNLQFRQAVPNQNEGNSPCIPIGTVGEFALINKNAETLAGKYIQTHDLNMAGNNWLPIGAAPIGVPGPVGPDYDFTGTFDGAGKKLENLTINRPNENYVGLFAYIKGAGAKLSNITVVSGTVQGNSHVGAICGGNFNGGTIKNCYNAAEVRADNSGGGIVGMTGLIAMTEWAPISTRIEGCVNTGAVYGDAQMGGISGMITPGAGIINCLNTADVVGTGWRIGGVCGASHIGVITASVNTGNVRGIDTVGGVAGENWVGGAIITASYSTGDVSGNKEVGGVAGTNFSGRISASYSTGNVSGSLKVGGVVGWDRESPAGSVTNCFWTTYAGSAIGVTDAGSSAGCSQFSGGSWPASSDENWGASYWRSLGGIAAGIGGTPAYPVLVWQEG